MCTWNKPMKSSTYTLSSCFKAMVLETVMDGNMPAGGRQRFLVGVMVGHGCSVSFWARSHAALDAVQKKAGDLHQPICKVVGTMSWMGSLLLPGRM